MKFSIRNFFKAEKNGLAVISAAANIQPSPSPPGLGYLALRSHTPPFLHFQFPLSFSFIVLVDPLVFVVGSNFFCPPAFLS